MCQRINDNPQLSMAYTANVADLAVYNYEEQLPKQALVFLVCSTWSEGTPPESCRGFFEWLKDYAYDFRVSKDHLAKVHFALFGCGSAYYEDHFCSHLQAAHEQLLELGATALEPMKRGDDQIHH